MKNLVFIGLPGCGKTTVSQAVAAALDRPWFDSDAEIESEEGMNIADIFAVRGEEYFRDRETACIGRLMRENGAVIAVGGGAVLRNAALIRENAFVVYLTRGIPDILSTLEEGTRPLLAEPDRLYTLERERRPLYERLCDRQIANDGDVADTVRNILEVMPCNC